MIKSLESPEVVRCYFDDAFAPPLPAMSLRWADDEEEHHWRLPVGVCLGGVAPKTFGITMHRERSDAYSVRLLWDRTCFHWPALTRHELLDCDLEQVLSAIGMDLWCLLDQPIHRETNPPLAA